MGGLGPREKGVVWKSPQPGREALMPSLSHALCFLSLSESTDNLADPRIMGILGIRNGAGRRGGGGGGAQWIGRERINTNS